MSSELKKASVGLTFIGAILLFLVFGVVVLVVLFWPRTKPVSLDEERAKTRSVKLELLQKENHAKLSTYAWVNKDKGVVQIPIDHAMELVATELAAKAQTVSAVKVENPYPYGLATFSFAPAPAASGTAAKPAASGSAAPAASGSGAPAASGSAAPAPAASGSAAPSAPPK